MGKQGHMTNMNPEAGNRAREQTDIRKAITQVIEFSPISADASDGERQVCVLMLARLRNPREPGALKHQGEEEREQA